jgi:hypothetical protein
MVNELDELFGRHGGVATTAQLTKLVGRAAFETGVANGRFIQVWTGIYSREPPNRLLRLRGLDLRVGAPVSVCLGTAAGAFGFDTEDTADLHVLTPVGHQPRAGDGLVVHRREGAPLTVVDGRLATAPAWTAVEVARGLRRPRALATLDAALRSGACENGQLVAAAARQCGRRGIVVVRELLAMAAAAAESPMESEARLAMYDAGLPPPVLQHNIIDRNWRNWRVDFAWPDALVAVEYDGFDWHSDPDALRRDRQKRGLLRVFRTAVFASIYAARCEFTYSVRTSCGVR